MAMDLLQNPAYSPFPKIANRCGFLEELLDALNTGTNNQNAILAKVKSRPIPPPLYLGQGASPDHKKSPAKKTQKLQYQDYDLTQMLNLQRLRC